MKYIEAGWVGRVLGVGGKPKVGNTIHKEANTNVVPSVGTETATANLVERDDRQQQFDTPSSLINAHQWPHKPYSRPSWFYNVNKRPPVKAYLAIYGPLMVCLDSAIVWLPC